MACQVKMYSQTLALNINAFLIVRCYVMLSFGLKLVSYLPKGIENLSSTKRALLEAFDEANWCL